MEPGVGRPPLGVGGPVAGNAAPLTASELTSMLAPGISQLPMPSIGAPAPGAADETDAFSKSVRKAQDSLALWHALIDAALASDVDFHAGVFVGGK